ncbi:MAG: hypothetical protein NTX67_05715 [Burkholderiales bacterium]|nr:hypothetical protein [Burkholderiales bacterium]
MKRDYFSHSSKDGHRQPIDQQSGSCIALIDARFLVWLAQHTQSGPKQDALNRYGIAQFLTGALAHAGLDVTIKRIYWYSEDNESLDVDGQIVRKVLSHDTDGGISLLKALGQDLRRLAESKACDHVLLATDDERFLSSIDDAQLAGLQVHILADDAASNMQQLHQTDPGWGRLLSQADRRVVVQSKSLAEMLQSAVSKELSQVQEDPQVVKDAITDVIVSWWDDEPEDRREELRDALHISRGIPQEVDRQLLLRMRHRLTRALTLPEKKLLREIFRAVALGTHSPEASALNDTGSSSPLIEEPI